jgi:hypothetical protein
LVHTTFIVAIDLGVKEKLSHHINHFSPKLTGVPPEL